MILPCARRYSALPFSAADSGVTLRARDERETARLPAGGEHLRAAREALVRSGSRLTISLIVYWQSWEDVRCSESFDLLRSRIVREHGMQVEVSKCFLVFIEGDSKVSSFECPAASVLFSANFGGQRTWSQSP
jgi:hypothetical protein